MPNIKINGTDAEIKTGIEKAIGLQSSASEIDEIVESNALFTSEYLAMQNTNIDYIDMIIDGEVKVEQTTQIVDFSKDFTITCVLENLGYDTAYNEYLSGAWSGDDALRFGITRNTAVDNVSILVKGNNTNYYKTKPVDPSIRTLGIVVSFDVANKQFTLSINGNTEAPFDYVMDEEPTLPIFLGKVNRNGVENGNACKIADFTMYPRAFDKDDVANFDLFFRQKWNLDTFTVKDSWTSYQKKVVSDISNKVGIEVNSNQVLDYLNTRLSSASSVCILGDSISHGAYVTDISRKSYVNLLKKYLTTQFDSKNYGFETISQEDGEWNESLFHSVSTVGTWNLPSTTDRWSLNGYELFGGVGAEINFTISDLREQKFFRINYVRDSTTNFSCEVRVNGNLINTDTITSTGGMLSPIVGSLKALSDNGSNGATINVKVTSGTARISGVTYFNNEDDFTLNNYSQSGRKAKDVKEVVINSAFSNNDVIFWHLGHNDANSTGQDLIDFKSTLDKVKIYTSSKNIFLVISDFLWISSNDNEVKIKNKEIVKSLGNGSYYVNIPPKLTKDGNIPTSSYLTSDLVSWADTSHPNNKGHKILFSQLKKELRL